MKQLTIRMKRQANKWTQKFVGSQVGLTKTSIHDIETGKQKPSYDVLLKLCKLFNVEHKEIEKLFAVVSDNDNFSKH